MDISRLADLLKNKASSAVEDYSQLANAYPNLKNFAGSLVGNIERNVPTQAELENPDYMQQRALNYMSPMAGAIKAYHGTPHEFDRFDMSKIGTGEGMQARGYGHYLSESPEFAEQFMSANDPAARHAYMVLDRFGGDIKQAIKDTNEQLKLMKKHSQYIVPEAMEKQENALNILKAKKAGKNTDVGAIYETSIQWPDPARESADPLSEHHLLNWDKPLSEQSKTLQDSVNTFIKNNIPEESRNKFLGLNPTGEDLYEALQMMSPRQKENEIAKDTSHQLNQLGIPGIKYSTKDITNYVMFGDEYPQIVNRASSLAQLLRGK